MMKKILSTAILFAFLMTGCSKDFLNRTPLSQISPDNAFKSENELQLYVNSFYDALPAAAEIYSEDADNVVKTILTPELTGNRIVPVSEGGWSWSELRNINYFLQHYERGGLAPAVTNPYAGVARFFRAYFYFDKVARFGDVPWYAEEISPNDETSLTKPRDPRTLVMDSIMADLDFAIAHCNTEASTEHVTKWTALALKSRICLFEGTFRKYHTELDLPNAEKYLQECISASEELMNSGVYHIYKSTQDNAYQELFTSMTAIPDEIILARKFSRELQVTHNVNDYIITPTQGRPGLEKKLVNSYLMDNGTRFTDIPGFESLSFYQQVQDRDPRLAQTIRTPGYTRMDENTVRLPEFGSSVTGYQPIKFLTGRVNDGSNNSHNDLPVFRYAEVLLNFAEAKAELNELTQQDVDVSVKLLRDRVGMPNLDAMHANTVPDPVLGSQYTQVTGSSTGVILEIRRERRVELIMEGFRWNDLMRWKEGHLVSEPFKGMYFPGPGSYDLDQDGSIDVVIYEGTRPDGPDGIQYLSLGSQIDLENGRNGGNIVVNKDIPKTFNEDRDYLYPIPTQELLLNPNLTQNPNW